MFLILPLLKDLCNSHNSIVVLEAYEAVLNKKVLQTSEKTALDLSMNNTMPRLLKEIKILLLAIMNAESIQERKALLVTEETQHLLSQAPFSSIEQEAIFCLRAVRSGYSTLMS